MKINNISKCKCNSEIATVGRLADTSISIDTTKYCTVNDLEEKIKKEVIKVLLSDPDSEVKKIAEDYLIQCLYDATEIPEKNPILHKFLLQKELEIFKNEITQLRAEIDHIWSNLGEEKRSNYYTQDHVVWKNSNDARLYMIEDKLNRLNTLISEIENKRINTSDREN